MAYGMVSELVKLNLYYDRSYNILSEITNFKSIYDSCVRQVYRLFGVWTELGGNIIQHVKVHGFFHGITYVKSFAGYFGFEYVSLPLLSAKYISASYAAWTYCRRLCKFRSSWCGDKYVDSICNCRRKSYIFLKEKKCIGTLYFICSIYQIVI